MKKIKWIGAVCLAIVLAAIVTSVSVSARALDPASFASDYVKSYRFLFTHPQEYVDTVKMMVERTQSDELSNYIANSEDAQAFLRVANLPLTGARLNKALKTTVNPLNSEKNRILQLNISNSTSPGAPKVDHGLWNHDFTLLNAPFFSKNTISIDPKFVYKTANDELVVWGVMMNYSNQNVEVMGVPEISLQTGDKVLASGTSSDFDSPMKFSYYQDKVNTGVYDGLPTQCFIKITFEPGTYDDTIDISNLDNLDCQYALNYRVID